MDGFGVNLRGYPTISLNLLKNSDRDWKYLLIKQRMWGGDIMTFFGIGMMNLEYQKKRNKI